MYDTDSRSDESRPHSPSLLARALDMPSLDHDGRNNRRDSERSSVSSSSASPKMAAPFGDKVDNGYGVPNSVHESPHSSESFVLSDTPVTKNKTTVANASPTSNPKLRMPPPMNGNISPYFKHNNNSFQSVGDSSVNSSVNSSVGTSSSYIRGEEGPRHSDFTIPTSNILGPPSSRNNSLTGSEEPPLTIRPAKEPTVGRTTKVRSILGNTVGKKYNVRGPGLPAPVPTPTNYGSIPPLLDVVTTTPTAMAVAMTPLSSESASMEQSLIHQSNHGDSTIPGEHQHHAEDGWQASHSTAQHSRNGSRMDPRVLPCTTEQYHPDYDGYYHGSAPKQNPPGAGRSIGASDPECQELLPKGSLHRHSSSRRDISQSVHAQSLLVGLAFMVVWLPNNAMAPNLTQMADFFGMNEAERDLYLGSYCALALGVFSLPVSGLIGFMADFYSRKHLFLACCVLGALSAAWSGWSPNYWNLFVARLCSGGCMSGSVPVAFSMMGDLFSKEERNAASSGLTSMMGLGILLGQIYAGEVGPSRSWQYPFYASAVVQLAMAVIIAFWVEEPVRGGKEKALQGVFKAGNKYDRQLTLEGFIDTMCKNASNWILLWQGFLTSIPWGIVFVFLNDYLSQEKGFTVEEATFLVMLFGVGCAIGGVTGGYMGQFFMRGNRSNLPLFMAAATFLGIFPFVLLLNSDFPNHSGFRSKFYSVMGGCIASLPSVNIRPCILNVNPPESRGSALTAANLFVTLGRGMGPSCITLLGLFFQASRQTSFNITLSVFWTISGIQLLFLAKTLPLDQDAMEEGLKQYAAAAHGDSGSEDGVFIDEEDRDSGEYPQSPVKTQQRSGDVQPKTPDSRGSSTINMGDDEADDDKLYESIITSPPAQYITIDGKSARQSLIFIKQGIQEFGDEITHRNALCQGCDTISPSESIDDIRPGSSGDETTNNNDDKEVKTKGGIIFSRDEISQEEMLRRRDMWRRQQQK